MQRLVISTRAAWRLWLAENHDKEKSGVWLVFFKKHTREPTLEYDDAVEEALCFGWVDSIVKRIDDGTYCRKFTPRKDESLWAASNKQRVKKIIQEGRMTEFGMAKIRAAKKLGAWDKDPRPLLSLEMPTDFAAGLAENQKAKDFFDKLAPSHRKIYLWWITSAKRAETKAARIAKALDLLTKGQKL